MWLPGMYIRSMIKRKKHGCPGEKEIRKHGRKTGIGRNSMNENLLEKLQKYGKTDAYPLHMPGHKRQISHFTDLFAIDITEIEGFDNLFHAEEILKEAQERAAMLYGAEESFYLVNGSTCGILAAISASVPRGGSMLVARNCHKAVYHGLLLNGIHAEYLYPPADMARGMNGAISAEDVRRMLDINVSGLKSMSGNIGRFTVISEKPETDKCGAISAKLETDKCGAMSAKSEANKCGSISAKPETDKCGSISAKPETDRYEAIPEYICDKKMSQIAAVLITSPTYDGVVSDIQAIADVVHQAGAVLIVDEAHGAHFAMHDQFPQSAVACGADLVINSLHKTLPSLTQTALLHVQGDRVDRDRLRKYLGVYQSSSPSYVLMAGMDACISMMLREKKQLYDTFLERLEQMRKKLSQMQHLHLIDGKEPELKAYDFDRSKVLISTENCRLTGPELAGMLRRKYHMEPEMEAEQYVTAIMTAADTEEGFFRLTEALLEIDAELEEEIKISTTHEAVSGTEKCKKLSVRLPEEAVDKQAKRITLEPYRSNEIVLTITEADEYPKEKIALEESEGRISAEFVYRYPPGIPLLVPGERIPEGFCEQIKKDMAIGLHIQGLADYSGEFIYVIKKD